MSDKERLKDIKNARYFFHDVQDRDLLKYWNWLIEQAERVEELEIQLSINTNNMKQLQKEKDEWKDTVKSYYMTNQELREQNKRYREALEFYADEETYETKFATDTDEIFDPFTLIELDEGKKARQALEE